MNSDQIHVLKDFITKEQAKHLVNYIEDNLHILKHSKVWGDKRRFIPFGKDNFHDDAQQDLSIIKDIEPLLRNEIFPKIEKLVQESYNNRKKLFVSNFIMSKQYPNTHSGLHSDTDGGKNMHFKYSGVLYLNTMSSGGELNFPELNHTYNPIEGELVTFPSKPLEFVHSVEEIYQDRYTIPFWLSEYEFFKV
jgi:hypothetical protein